MTAVESTISAVTVYRQGARVTRMARIERNEGPPSQIRITGLPLCLDDSSIRIRVEAEAGDSSGPLPVAADARIALEVPEVDASLRPAEDEELEKARQKEARLRDLVAQIERELARLEKLAIVGRPKSEDGQAPNVSPTDARLAFVDFRDVQSHKLFDELHDTRVQLHTAERTRRELEDQNRRATTARQARESELRKSLIVTLQGEGGGTGRARLILEYMVPGARWAPAYTALLRTDSDEAELAMRAVVVQRTGEDWTGVALTLSTAKAHQRTELPELTSLRIGRRQPSPPRRGWRPPPTGVEELYADYDASFRDLSGKAKPAVDVPSTQSQAMDALPEAGLTLGMPSAIPAPDADAPSTAPVSAEQLAETMLESARPAATRSRAGLIGRSRAPRVQIKYEIREEEERPPGLRASDQMLAYGSLRMPPPRSPHRGRLVLADKTDIYLELLIQQRVVVSFDVMRSIRGATVVAESIGDRRPPPRCTYAWSDHYDYAYLADVEVDIPSDGNFHSIPITGRSTRAAQRFVTVPRESSDVFRIAEVENPLEAPLLHGPVDVYLDGDFLLTTEVSFTAPGGVIHLGLGVEQSIKVARNTRFQEDPAGPLRGSRSLQHEIRIEVINHLQRAVDLEVRERIPVTREDEEQIKVELTRVEPSWEPFQLFPEKADESELRGAYHWNFQVDPGGTRELSVDYNVRIPSKLELVGGNRREA